MVTALAALENGLITTSDYVTCRGSFFFGDRPFKCTHVHGRVNIVSAIEKSCNVFFYKLILKVGLERFAEFGRKMGFGKKTNLDIEEESAGIVPDAEYFDRAYGKGQWTEGYLISLAIGQGDLITTPVQLAQYCAILANNGRTKQPHFLKGWIESQTNQFYRANYEDIIVDISQDALDIVREGMYRVVQGDGTAQFIRQKKYDIAGKTGTAQNPHGEDHAIFIAFAPFENPKIAVAVIVENVGFGSTHAAPIARDVIKSYLSDIESKQVLTMLQDTRN
jgi:penicillin-binding protein 2